MFGLLLAWPLQALDTTIFVCTTQRGRSLTKVLVGLLLLLLVFCLARKSLRKVLLNTPIVGVKPKSASSPTSKS